MWTSNHATWIEAVSHTQTEAEAAVPGHAVGSGASRET